MMSHFLTFTTIIVAKRSHDDDVITISIEVWFFCYQSDSFDNCWLLSELISCLVHKMWSSILMSCLVLCCVVLCLVLYLVCCVLCLVLCVVSCVLCLVSCVVSCCVLCCVVSRVLCLVLCLVLCCVVSRVLLCVVPVWEQWASGRRLPWPPWCGCFPGWAAATAWGLRRREHASLWWKPCRLWPRRPTLPTPRPRPAETPPAERRSSVIVSPHERGPASQSRKDNSFIVCVQLIKPMTSQFWIKVLCAVVCSSASWSHVSTSLRLSARKTNRKNTPDRFHQQSDDELHLKKPPPPPPPHTLQATVSRNTCAHLSVTAWNTRTIWSSARFSG